MKAAIIDEHGGPGTIRIDPDFPDPQPGSEDVIVKVGATSLNYNDIFRLGQHLTQQFSDDGYIGIAIGLH